MSMLDRFRPKWQHSDVEVRASAVRRLRKEDTELLSAVARTDPDARVRRIAVKKLETPRLLLEIGEKDPDPGLREYATERAYHLLVAIAAEPGDPGECGRALSLLAQPKHLAEVAQKAKHEPIRRAALERLMQSSDTKTLAEVARAAQDPSIREAALAQLSDPSVLRALTGAEVDSDLALKAVERIDDPDTLQAIVEDHSTQKLARRRAQDKLESLVGPDHPFRIGQRAAELDALCQSLEGLAGEQDLDLAGARLLEVQTRWQQLAAPEILDDERGERFRQACAAVEAVLAQRKRQEAEKRQEEKRRQDRLSARIALCKEVEALTRADAHRRLEETRIAWDNLGPIIPGPEDAVAKRFSTAVSACQARYEGWLAWERIREQLEALTREGERLAEELRPEESLRRWPALQKRWAALTQSLDPSAKAFAQEHQMSLRTRLRQAEERTRARVTEEKDRRKRTEQRNLLRLQDLCKRLDALSKSEELSLKEADQLLRESQTFLKTMGPLPPSENRRKWRRHLAQARQTVFVHVGEQRELETWRRWANVELKEKLIRRMEALAESGNLREAAKQLREIHDEWKEIGAVPRDQSQALWERFKKARNEVRKRCEVFFATLHQGRTENLKLKTSLCEKVERLVDSTDWERTAAAIKHLQAEWKQIGPVSSEASQAIWRRFRKACNEFFDRRKKHYQLIKRTRDDNLKRKVELCEKAEALAQSTDWRKTAEELRRLQGDWKKVGSVPRKKSEEVWERFRKACDHFFDRYKRRDEVERQ
ncbi:MAG: DUF349 domain-containing protein, partial [Acidobacteriota bacterium]